MSDILVTGGTGFIGRHLVTALSATGVDVSVLVRAARREDVERLWSQTVTTVAGDLLNHSNLDGVCDGVETVFHLAGYAHAEDANEDRADEIHWKITVEGTRALLREAVRAGVKRFIFASTVKAMGEGGAGQLDEAGRLAPLSGYGRAKLVAEELVLDAGKIHRLHVSIVRFPLVYGRDNKGNLPRMIAAVGGGRFPPLPPLANKRSMVHVDDAVRSLMLAAQKPQAGGQRYIVTDGHVYSTSDIYRQIHAGLGLRPPRWHIPMFALKLAAHVGDLIRHLRGRRFVFDSVVLGKLTESAWYSSEKIQRELGFRPTRSLEDGMPEMVNEYRTKDSAV